MKLRVRFVRPLIAIFLYALILLPFGSRPTFAQEQQGAASVAPFTKQQLWGLWQEALSSPLLLKSAEDFTKTIPVCFDANGIYQEHSLKVLATLKSEDVFLGLGPGATGGYDVIYVFKIIFNDRTHNSLYKYWFRNFPADYRPVKDIPAIAVQVGIEPVQENGSKEFQNISYTDGFKYDSQGFEFFIASDKDPAPTKYDDFLVFNDFGGVNFGASGTPNSPTCR